MSLTGIPVSFTKLYSKRRTIQNQLRDPSFQLYLPQPIEKELIPTIERAIINEQVTTVDTPFYPQTIQTTLTQAVAQPAKITSVQLDLPQQGQEPQIPPHNLFAITTSHKASQDKQMWGFQDVRDETLSFNNQTQSHSLPPFLNPSTESIIRPTVQVQV